MKTCPTCNKTYDDSLRFCLNDGSELLQPTMLPSDPNKTLRLPVPNVTAPGPTVASPQPTASPRSDPPMQWNPPVVAASSSSTVSRHNPLPWILGIVVVAGIFGVVIALIVTRSRNDSNQVASRPSPGVSPVRSGELKSASPEPSPEVKHTASRTPTPAVEPTIKPKKNVPEPVPGTVVITRPVPKETPV